MKVIKKLLRGFFDLFGLQISRKTKTSAATELAPFGGYDYATQGFEAIKLVRSYSMLAAVNLQTLYEQAAYCEKKNIPGAFVELGVWKGGAVGIMAKANLDYGLERRDIHLFDAFDDICAPNAEVDGAQAVADMKKYAGITDEKALHGQLEPMTGMYDFLGGHGTIDACRELLERKLAYPSSLIHYHKGWFQDTVPVDAPGISQIAILRLDGDWYDSIKISLEYFYDKVVKGGVVVIDDYGYYEGCTRAVDEFLASKNIKTFLSYSNIGVRYFVKP